MILGEKPAPWEEGQTAAQLGKRFGHMKHAVMALLDRSPSARPSMAALQNACHSVLASTTTTLDNASEGSLEVQRWNCAQEQSLQAVGGGEGDSTTIAIPTLPPNLKGEHLAQSAVVQQHGDDTKLVTSTNPAPSARVQQHDADTKLFTTTNASQGAVVQQQDAKNTLVTTTNHSMMHVLSMEE